MTREPATKIQAMRNRVGAPVAARTRIPSIYTTISAFSWALLVIFISVASASADSSSRTHLAEQLALSDSPTETVLRPLDVLLTVPDAESVWRGDRTDEDLAFAVALGNDPALEKRNPFRKKSFDLFRAERQVMIGQSQMLIRLRVRPKSRETMSIELKY